MGCSQIAPTKVFSCLATLAASFLADLKRITWFGPLHQYEFICLFARSISVRAFLTFTRVPGPPALKFRRYEAFLGSSARETGDHPRRRSPGPCGQPGFFPAANRQRLSFDASDRSSAMPQHGPDTRQDKIPAGVQDSPPVGRRQVPILLTYSSSCRGFGDSPTIVRIRHC